MYRLPFKESTLNANRLILSIFIACLLLSACGGENDDDKGSSGPPSDVTLRSLGGDIVANAGAVKHVARYEIKCPVTGTLCKVPVTLSSLTLNSDIPLSLGYLWFNNQWHNGLFTKSGSALNFSTTEPIVFRQPGYMEISAATAFDATVGSSGTVSVSALGVGTPRIEVVGSTNKLTVGASPIVFSSISPTVFSKANGMSEVGGFDILCPVNTNGCTFKEMRLAFESNAQGGELVKVFVGTVPWYEFQAKKSANGTAWDELMTLTSPITIPPGQKVRISFQSTLTWGSIEIYYLDVIAVKNGFPLGKTGPTNACEGIITFGCKG